MSRCLSNPKACSFTCAPRQATGIEDNEIAQNVPFERLNEGRTSTLKPLEEVRAAETHQPVPGAR